MTYRAESIFHGRHIESMLSFLQCLRTFEYSLTDKSIRLVHRCAHHPRVFATSIPVCSKLCSSKLHMNWMENGWQLVSDVMNEYDSLCQFPLIYFYEQCTIDFDSCLYVYVIPKCEILWSLRWMHNCTFHFENWYINHMCNWFKDLRQRSIQHSYSVLHENGKDLNKSLKSRLWN